MTEEYESMTVAELKDLLRKAEFASFGNKKRAHRSITRIIFC